MELFQKRRALVIYCFIFLVNAVFSKADDICIGRDEFENRFTSIEQELQQLRQENSDLHAKVKAMERNKSPPSVPLSDSPIHEDYPVISRYPQKRFVVNGEGEGAAFSVTIAADGIEHLGVNQTIHFDKVVSNYGNHFDTRLGAFRAPVSGWYVFSVTLMARPQQTQYLYVMKNGTMVFHVYSQGTDYATDSKTMVVHLDQNDEVWVQTSELPGLAHAVHGSEHTSFTGFLLYTD